MASPLEGGREGDGRLVEPVQHLAAANARSQQVRTTHLIIIQREPSKVCNVSSGEDCTPRTIVGGDKGGGACLISLVPSPSRSPIATRLTQSQSSCDELRYDEAMSSIRPVSSSCPTHIHTPTQSNAQHHATPRTPSSFFPHLLDADGGAHGCVGHALQLFGREGGVEAEAEEGLVTPPRPVLAGLPHRPHLARLKNRK